MTDVLPDCMMPDGADPCAGYHALCARVVAAEKQIAELCAALDVRDMWINPDKFAQAADEIDCYPGCEYYWYESDTNASGCVKYDRGDYCPNDVAETLRAVGKIARKASDELNLKP